MYRLSHELKNPLHFLQGGIEDLVYSIGEGKTIAMADVMDLHRSAGEMMQHLNNVLSAARSENREAHMNSVSIKDDILKRAKDDVKKISSTMHLECIVADSIPDLVAADGGRIAEVLQNYISNAIKQSKEGAELELRVALDAHVAPTEEHHWLCFSVLDEGNGVKEADREKLFTAFMQNEASPEGGTGLGLFICAQLAATMNGHVGMNPRQKKGSEFWLWLAIPLKKVDSPFQKEALAEKQVEVPSSSSADVDASSASWKEKVRNLRVLVVDDNALNRKITSKMITRRLSISHVDTAVNGKDAVERVQAQHYDMILMDMQMPVLSGLEAAKIIRANQDSAHPPIIVAATGAIEENVRAECAGIMDDILLKPFGHLSISKLFEKFFR